MRKLTIKMNIKKYSSFYMAFFFFSSILIVLNNWINMSIISPDFLLVLLLVPIIFKLNFDVKTLFVSLIFLIVLLLNVFIHIEYLDLYQGKLISIITLGLAPCIIGAVKVEFNSFIQYLKNFSILNIVLLLVYLDKKVLGGKEAELTYMSIGYFLSYGILVLSYWNCFGEKKKWRKFINIFLIFISTGANFLYGSRFSSAISYFGIILILFLYKRKYIWLFIPNILIVLKFKEVLKILLNFLKFYNIENINLNRFYYGLKSTSNFLSGRQQIYTDVLNVIKSNPFGIGIYGYINKLPQYDINTFYPHNIFLEVTLQFGILGLLIFFVFLIYIFYKILKIRERRKKIFFITLIVINLQLLVSGSYLHSLHFSLLITLIFNRSMK